ncbi:MAG: C2 family cysteine protease [Candidatus Gastranaerophilales bacterium]|nr:C2 family cysteine protease [Candidatus Gastranaerophilales bacterium]
MSDEISFSNFKNYNTIINNTKNGDDSGSIYSGDSDTNININGEIDEPVYQGKTGDCWFLSGILSLSYTDRGQEILKNAISQNDNGDYEVYFKGMDKTYTITQEELIAANNATIDGVNKYSSGDDDMLLLELAAEKLYQEIYNDDITGGFSYNAYNCLTDDSLSYYHTINSDKMFELLDYYKENQDTVSATLAISNEFDGYDLPTNHEYAVKSYDGETLHITNPWDSTSDITLTKEDLINNYGRYSLSTSSPTEEGNEKTTKIIGSTLGGYLGYKIDNDNNVQDSGEIETTIILENDEETKDALNRYGFTYQEESGLYYKENNNGSKTYARFVTNSNNEIDLKYTTIAPDGTSSTKYYKKS